MDVVSSKYRPPISDPELDLIGDVPTVLCPNCHALVKVPNDSDFYRCSNCFVFVRGKSRMDVVYSEYRPPFSDPELDLKDGSTCGWNFPTVRCPNCHAFVNEPNSSPYVSYRCFYRCSKCLVSLRAETLKFTNLTTEDPAAETPVSAPLPPKDEKEDPAAETPVSAPLPPKDEKAVGFISSLFKKKRQINFFRRAPKYEEKLAPSPCSDLTEQSVEEEHHAMNFGLACVFPYEELKEATNRFNELQVLGGGGFGRVYLGKLKDGRRVAVKKLYNDNPKQLEQFFNEVTVLSRLRHKNLVALYGCTNPQSRKKLLLVYEFIPNGTVADHLHGQQSSLPWAVRIQIATETAEALSYLHSLEPPIIHRDVKTSNILLDNTFQVKVADLGMCRLLPWDTTYVSTAPQGTMGYRDPEYDLYCKLSDKSDVYSFGVVLLELVSGKQVVDVNRDSSEIYLTRMGLNMIQNNQVEQLVDPELGYHSSWKIRKMVDSVIELACKCLQSQGYLRPPMIEVLMVLKTIEEMVKTEEATTVDLLKNNVTLGINQTSTTHPPTPIIEIKMENKRLPIEAVREFAFSGSSNILYASNIELVKVYNPSYLPCKSGIIVYQGKFTGKFTDGRTVKVLKECKPKRMEEFYKVVSSHSSFHHQNLVTLYGWPDKQGQELLLVYELLPNGTLADHLHGKSVAKEALTFDVRIQIAIDTAQALAYLQSFYPPVVHGRVKTDTILLDNNFNAKVVDLGLCHLLSTENEQHSKLSAKWDVYSFGVVLMELISGNPTVDVSRECDEINVTSIHKKLNLLVDNKLRYETNSEIRWSVSSVAQLAFRCLQPNENKRPHMKEVLRILKCISEQQTILKRTSQQSSQSPVQRDIGQSSWLAE